MSAVSRPAGSRRKRRLRPARVLLHVFLAMTGLVWLAPVLWATFNSFRPYEETSTDGFVSWPKTLTLDNFRNAWNGANLPHYYLNTLIVAVPALVLILLLSSSVAYIVTRRQMRFSKSLMVFFTVANLLPPQILLVPMYRIYLAVGLPPVLEGLEDRAVLYDTYTGIVLAHVAFQVGFCTFVLSNYMKTIPKELDEAARVDGASIFRHFRSIILPLCRPALGALATLEFTWIYNDFLWALVLMKTGDRKPVTSAIANLQGQFFTDTNLLAAASVMVALPTLIVYFVLQKQFVGGLTLGANKG